MSTNFIINQKASLVWNYEVYSSEDSAFTLKDTSVSVKSDKTVLLQKAYYKYQDQYTTFTNNNTYADNPQPVTHLCQLNVNFTKPIDSSKIMFRYFTPVSLDHYEIIDNIFLTHISDNQRYALYNKQKYNECTNNRKIRIYTKGKPNNPNCHGGIVVASYFDKEYKNFDSPNGVLYIGLSVCNANDKFDFRTGKEIAITRLLNESSTLNYNDIALPMFGKFMITGLTFPSLYHSVTSPILKFDRMIETYLNSLHHDIARYTTTIITTDSID
jgi:hypothetical protein